VDIILDGTWHLGSLMAYLFTLVFYNLETSHVVWRFLFLFGAVGAIPIIFLRNQIPESPRWLIY